MSWIGIVITAHALNAINFVLDKFLLSKAIKDSFVYTFAIGVLGLCVVVLIPFGFEFPGYGLLLVNLITGIFFILALTLFFRTLQLNEASRIVPVIGSTVPIVTFILSFFFLGERLNRIEIFSFFLLILGTYLITIDINEKARKKKFTMPGLGLALLAGACFAISFVLNKYVFETQPFFSGFIWIRMGSFLAVVVMLMKKGRFSQVRKMWRATPSKVKGLFVGNQLVGAGAFLLISYAIALASVTLVNALQGVQYAILLVFAALLSYKYPKVLSEKISHGVLVQKVTAIVCIGVALFLLSYSQ